MRRIILVAVVAAAALAMGMGGGPVAAQDANETATNTTASDYEEIIDSNTRILEWSFDDGTFTITLEADEPTTVAVAESGSFEEGSGQFTYRELAVPEGESTHTISVMDPEGAALTFGTSLSQEEERGAFISTGRDSSESNPLETFGGESGLFTGVGMTVVLAAVGAWWVVRSEESGVIDA
ncbi:hypothetical protein [Natrinema salaciae]|uniref:Uncharacterized protein n=1 Tax=Natrinema salaciae TaxID=1186196 RepID=A0A1H9LUM7_9EURY|nr:hypothetical protein [Natrinema salaciae]SER15202.1 hypothetical protein SAMN04489841_3096 [Natrinema salaciae]